MKDECCKIPNAHSISKVLKQIFKKEFQIFLFSGDLLGAFLFLEMIKVSLIFQIKLGLRKEPLIVLDAWRSGTEAPGAQCVTTPGTLTMPRWCVASWDVA